MDNPNPRKLLEILANKNRSKIYRLLLNKELYPQQLASELDITPSAVIKHLRILEEQNLISKEERNHQERPGGRKLKVYAVNTEIKNLSINFDLNTGMFRVYQVDYNNLDDNESLQFILQEEIKSKDAGVSDTLKNIIKLQLDIQELLNKRIQLQRHRELSYEQLEGLIDPNVLEAFRMCLEEFGDKEFTRQQLTSRLEKKFKPEDINSVLEEWDRLKIIEVDNSDWINPTLRFRID